MGLFDILGNAMVQEEIRSVVDKVGTNFGGKGGFDLGSLLGQGGGTGSLAGAGALGALLGTLLPKGATRTASVLGLGAVAYSFYKKWAQANQSSQPFADTMGFSDNFGADPVSTLLLRTMVYAAKADGRIDEAECSRIEALVPQLFPNQDVQPILDKVLAEPADLHVLANSLQSVEQGEDLYRLSCIIMDVDHFAERGYLAELGHALGLSVEKMQKLEKEATQAKQQIDRF
ncbi:MAG: DUF533 domain-containing protein [Desulfovibrio sp.]|nr:DUF533 domain-containing protein [Desulfovibrio sp.]